jgi:hypothetical protein
MPRPEPKCSEFQLHHAIDNELVYISICISKFARFIFDSNDHFSGGIRFNSTNYDFRFRGKILTWRSGNI